LELRTFGTQEEGLTNERILEIIKRNFNFEIESIVKELNLTIPHFKKMAKFGLFGRQEPEFTWEKAKGKLAKD